MTEYGPLTHKVIEYTDTIVKLLPTARNPEDWAPLSELVSTEEFTRTGTFMEKQNWQQCTEMLSGWAQAVDSFETIILRVTEVDDLVYYEVEERHFRDGAKIHVVNSATVFQFNADGKIANVAVYLQAPAGTIS